MLLSITSTNVWTYYLPIGFFLAFAFAIVVLPNVMRIAKRYKLYDKPDARKVHVRPIPRLGGVVFTPSILFSLFMIWGIHYHLIGVDIQGGISQEVGRLSFAVCALMVLYFVGLGDDLIGLSARSKFVVQFACALLLLSGFSISSLHGVLFLYELPVVVEIPLTALVLVFVINAINLIDGIDGLASSLSVLAMVYYAIGFVLSGQYVYALISFTSIGAILPFIYYNVFGSADYGKKIFMGDAGSLSIGLLLCILATQTLSHPPLPIKFNPIYVAFAPLLLPCLDVVRVFVYRISRGRSPFAADRNHIHHYLLDMGLSHRQALIVLLFVSIVLTLLNLTLCQWLDPTLLLVLDGALGLMFVLYVLRERRKAQLLSCSAK